MLKLMGIDIWKSRTQVTPEPIEEAALPTISQPETTASENNIGSTCVAKNDSEQTIWTLNQSGSLNASCWFVIQRPIDQEILQKKCDRLLDAILFSQDQTEESVCVLNATQARVGGTQAPEKALEQSLKNFLGSHQPKAIIMLGEQLAQALLNTDKTTTTMRNEQYKYSEGGCQLFITHSLEHLLNNPNAKTELWQDLNKVNQHVS